MAAAPVQQQPASTDESGRQARVRAHPDADLTTLDRLRELFAERADVPLTNVPANAHRFAICI